MKTLIWILMVAAAEGQEVQEQTLMEVIVQKMQGTVAQTWQYVSTLGLIEALVFISFGSVCAFYGWRIFKILATICFGMIGLSLGIWANTIIHGSVIWLGLICTIFFGVLSVPFMRWGVTLLGAFSGGVLTSGAWLAASLPQELVWAGALAGFIAGGMISFAVFKAAVIMFTSLGGSVLMAVGILAIVYQRMLGGTDEQFNLFVAGNPWFLPALLLLPVTIGMVLQHRGIKASQDWSE